MVLVGYLFNNMFMDGHIENLSILHGMEDINLTTYPYTTASKLTPVLQALVGDRARSMFMLNTGSVFSTIYKAVSYFMSEATTTKVQVTSGNTHELITNNIAAEQLE